MLLHEPPTPEYEADRPFPDGKDLMGRNSLWLKPLQTTEWTSKDDEICT